MVGRGIRESEEMGVRGHKGRETEEGGKGWSGGEGEGHQPVGLTSPSFYALFFQENVVNQNHDNRRGCQKSHHKKPEVESKATKIMRAKALELVFGDKPPHKDT